MLSAPNLRGKFYERHYLISTLAIRKAGPRDRSLLGLILPSILSSYFSVAGRSSLYKNHISDD